jgi:hypothetical protein
MGLLWLIGCLLFMAAALLFLLRKDWWWVAGVSAVVLSQALIIGYWPDAKFGTIANVIALLSILPAFGTYRFNHMVQKEIQTLLPRTIPVRTIVTGEMLTDLPPIVQGWLRRSGVVGKEMIHTIHLHQQGQLRTKPNGRWMPVTAEQYVIADQPGFIWVADVQAAPLVHLPAATSTRRAAGTCSSNCFR